MPVSNLLYQLYTQYIKNIIKVKNKTYNIRCVVQQSTRTVYAAKKYMCYCVARYKNMSQTSLKDDKVTNCL